MKYRYSGPTSGVTLQGADENSPEEVMLHTGAEVELPEDNDYTKTLLALGYLTPIKPAGKTSRTSADETAAKGA